MLSTKKKKYLIFACMIFLPILIGLASRSYSFEPPSSSAINSRKIHLTSNNDLDAFVSGNGTTGLTLETAHIIKDFVIHTDSDDFGIFIQNIDRFLILRNCTVFASEVSFSDKSGIEIRLSTNIYIDNCTVSYYNIGIQLLDTHHSFIVNSTTFQNQEAGIKLLEADHNILDENLISNNLGYGIYLKRSHENTVKNNIIEDNVDLGILDKGINNIFENNSCEPSTRTTVFNKTWLWVILGVGGAVFFIGGLMFFITWHGRN